MHLSMSSQRRGGGAKGGILIDRFGPGVGHFNYLAVPGVGIFEGIENKLRLQTLSIDNAWSNKNFLYFLTFRMLQHTSSEVNGYNCYKHFKKYKNKEGNW